MVKQRARSISEEFPLEHVWVGVHTTWDSDNIRELLQKGSRKRRPKTNYFIRLSYGPKLYVNRP